MAVDPAKLADGIHWKSAHGAYKWCWYIHEKAECEIGWVTNWSTHIENGKRWISLNAACMPNKMGTATVPMVIKGGVVYMVDLPEITTNDYNKIVDPKMFLAVELVTIPHEAFPAAFNEGYLCGKYD